MNAQKLVLIFILCIYVNQICSNELNQIVSTWIEIKQPSVAHWEEYNKFVLAANNSDIAWDVSLENNHVVANMHDIMEINFSVKEKDLPIKKFSIPSENTENSSDKMLQPSCVLAVYDGYLVAYNRGEFGSSLWWYSKTSSDKYKISDYHVNQLISTQKGVYAAEGLAHLNISQGSLINIVNINSQWKAHVVAKTGGSAEALALLSNGDFIIATSSSLVRVTSDYKIYPIIHEARWAGLYPSSIAIDSSGVVFIGMRQFVASVDLNQKNPKVRFLLPSLDLLNKH